MREGRIVPGDTYRAESRSLSKFDINSETSMRILGACAEEWRTIMSLTSRNVHAQGPFFCACREGIEFDRLFYDLASDR